MNDQKPLSRYEYSLLDLCGRIHGNVTGSGDGIPWEEAERIAVWLGWRIGEGCAEYPAAYEARLFGEAVHGLCFAALIELNADLVTRRNARGHDRDHRTVG